MWRANSLEKTLLLGKIDDKRRSGWQKMRWLDSIIDSMDMCLSKFCEIVKVREVKVTDVLQSMGLQRVRHYWATEQHHTAQTVYLAFPPNMITLKSFFLQYTLFKKFTSLCENEVTQSCLTLWNPMGCSLPGSSIHGIFQARILQWVAISFSRRSSWHQGLNLGLP